MMASALSLSISPLRRIERVLSNFSCIWASAGAGFFSSLSAMVFPYDYKVLPQYTQLNPLREVKEIK